MGKINIEEVWKNQPEETAALQDKEINTIRLRKSEGFLERLQKNARIEHYMNVGVSVFVTVGFLVSEKWTSALVATILFMMLVFYYHNLYKALWQLRPTADVHEFLEILTTKMKSFIQKYYAGLLFVMPLSLSIGLWFGSDGEVNWNKYTSPEGIGLLVLAFVLAIGLSHFMVELMYGRTYKKLKQLLAELDQKEESSNG